MPNQYDELYLFRKATVEDTDKIMAFIRNEWNPDHILGTDKELFLWQYGRSEYDDFDNINFIVMTDKIDNIVGMIGYIAYDKGNNSISPAMTKVSQKVKIPLAGLELMRRQMKLVGERAQLSSGTNSKTILPLYDKVFHYTTGIMQQYYIINRNIKDYKIASPILAYDYNDHFHTKFRLKEVFTFEETVKMYDVEKTYNKILFKSKNFLKKRYYDHPIYKYRKWIVIDDKEEKVGLLFGREIVKNNAKIMRIVDYRGDLENLKLLGDALHNLISENQYEYIDLMVSDLSEFHLEMAGFNLLDPDGKTIIPHYFEPFIRENKKNYYENNTEFVIFKADGDQDRPNFR